MRRRRPKLSKGLLSYLDKRLGVHAGNGPEYVYHCPACLDRRGSESSKRKLSINLAKHVGQCLRCEFKFRSLDRLFRYLNGGHLTPEERVLLQRDPPIVVESVQKTVRKILAPPASDESSLKPHPLPRAYTPLTPASAKVTRLRPALAYLRGRRKVSLETAERFQVGYCPGGPYRGYLIFPVVQFGEVVYWTSRFCGEHNIKSRNPSKEEGYHSRQTCLLNFDGVLGQPRVAMVEGPFDMMAPPHAFALMGKVMNPEQAVLVETLVEHGLEELVVMLDPHSGIQIDEIRATLIERVPKVSIAYLTHGDPDERRDEILSIMEERTDQPSIAQRVRSRLKVGT